MTWLISLIESAASEIELPYLYHQNFALHHSQLAADELERNNVPHLSEYTSVDGELGKRFTISFQTTQQMVSYLNFESRVVIAQQMAALADTKPNRKTKILSREDIKNRIADHYRNVTSRLQVTTPSTVATEQTASVTSN